MFENLSGLTDSKIQNIEFRQLVRMVHAENNFMIDALANAIKSDRSVQEGIDELEASYSFPNSYKKNTRVINEALDLAHSIEDDNLSEFFDNSQGLDKQQALLCFKMEEIISGVCDVDGLSSFWIVFSRLDEDPFIAYNGQKSGDFVVQPSFLESSAHVSELVKFGKGEECASLDSDKTVMEICFRDDGWVDLYSLKNVVMPEVVNIECKTDREQRLILVRLHAKGSSKESETSGVIGFSYQTSTSSKELAITQPLLLQLLLHIRRPLSVFNETHHESAEFISYRNLQKARSLLEMTGHSAAMMRDLAEDGEQDGSCNFFKSVAGTMQDMQSFVVSGNKSQSWEAIFFNKNRITAIDNMTLGFDFEALNLNSVIEKVISSGFIERALSGIKISSSVESDGSFFQFHGGLLKFIIFELLVNAKKNRYMNLPSSICQNKSLLSNENYNEIRLDFIISNDSVIVSCCSVGPQIDPETKKKLKARARFPGQYGNSGIELISMVLSKLGYVKESFLTVDDEICTGNKTGPFRNKVSLELVNK